MLLLLQYTLIFASVLLLVALGGCFSEHSGVINIGLEGIMVMGALGGALMMKFLPAGTSAFVVVLLTVLASILLGMIYSLLLAVAAVNFKADQTLVGTAMNLLGTAAATVFVKAMNTAADPDNVSSTIQYLDGRKAFLVNIGGFEFNWCMLLAVIALVIAYVVLYNLPLEAIVGMYEAILGGVAHVPTGNALFNCLLVFNVPFTLVKGLLDVALCFLIYKPLSPLLHK